MVRGRWFPAMPGRCIGTQLWEKSPMKQMKCLGIDKYHGSYVELRSGSKLENMKDHLLKCMNIVTKRVRPCLSLLLHISSWHKTSGQYSSVRCADCSTGKLLCNFSNRSVKCGTNLLCYFLLLIMQHNWCNNMHIYINKSSITSEEYLYRLNPYFSGYALLWWKSVFMEGAAIRS